MLRTIDRYVIRETIPPFLLSLVIFTFLLEIPPVMRDLEMLVAKGSAGCRPTVKPWRSWPAV